MWDCRFGAQRRDARNVPITMGATLIVIFSLSACDGGQSSSFVPSAGSGPVQAAVSLQTTPQPAGDARPKPKPSPTPTPVPTITPTPTPAPTGGGAYGWNNGQQIPASFLNQDFGAAGPLYQQLPANPQIDANSASAISYYFVGNPQFSAGWIDASSSQAQYDYNLPLYTSSVSDPLVKIVCTGGASCVDGGVQIHLPSLAQQAGGTDHHLAVLEPDGLEYDFWEVSSSPPYSNGSILSAAGEAHFTLSGASGGTGYIAPGFVSGAATAGGVALSIAQVYTSELAAGAINHALLLTFPCGTSSWVYPASQTSGICGNGQGMPLGSRVWWQPSDTQTNALAIAPDMKKILIALHHYGGFYIDSFGGVSDGLGRGMGARLENQEPYWTYGNGFDPALAYAQSAPGWNHITGLGVDRYVLAASGGTIDFLDNLKVLAPCITQGTC